jgi:hypothetical protein
MPGGYFSSFLPNRREPEPLHRGACKEPGTFSRPPWYPSGGGCTGHEERRKLLPHERKLLTDQQIRDASIAQIEDLVHRLNLALQERGVPGLVWQRASEDRVGEGRPARSDPFDPPAI